MTPNSWNEAKTAAVSATAAAAAALLLTPWTAPFVGFAAGVAYVWRRKRG